MYTFSDWGDRLTSGIDHFNRQEFFEAHEVWEDLWHEVRDEDRSFLQALIQVAAGLFHHQSDNPRGMASQLRKAGEKLSRYPAVHRGIDVGKLQADIQKWTASVFGGGPVSGRCSYPRITMESNMSPT